MNNADVSKQIQQMVRFIRQEAEEKANEISVSAEEVRNRSPVLSPYNLLNLLRLSVHIFCQSRFKFLSFQSLASCPSKDACSRR